MPEPLPPEPEPTPTPQPLPGPEPVNPEKKEIRCDFCKCRLDRRGNVLERGAKVREMMDAEDVIAGLRKELAAEKAAHEKTRGELSTTAAELAPFKSRRFGQLVRA